MGKLVFGMMQSLDGYVAGITGGPELPPPGVALHRYFNDHVRSLAGSLYGRRMYEVMRYWDEDRPEWGAVAHDFAAGAAEMGRITLAEGGGCQRRAGRGRCWGVRAPAKGGRRGRHRRRRARSGGGPHRPRSYRRVSSLLPPVRAWPRQAVL